MKARIKITDHPTKFKKSLKNLMCIHDKIYEENRYTKILSQANKSNSVITLNGEHVSITVNAGNLKTFSLKSVIKRQKEIQGICTGQEEVKSQVVEQ